MEADAAPSDNPQKLGLRASTAMTSSNVGARAAAAGTGSSAPRSGSRTVNLSSGVSTRPASPTMKNAMRQFTTLVM
jgi:hypothetical protein